LRRTYILLLAVWACGGEPTRGHTLADIKERGEITWGADLSGGEPYVYEDPAHPNQLVGFEVDIMDAIARRLGVKPRMVQYTWGRTWCRHIEARRLRHHHETGARATSGASACCCRSRGAITGVGRAAGARAVDLRPQGQARGTLADLRPRHPSLPVVPALTGQRRAARATSRLDRSRSKLLLD
jgi:ABC-type amino acid transport substrate-binding protein